MLTVATIVPAHNEAGCIDELTMRLWRTYNSNQLHGQIILAANGCTDNTVEQVRDLVQDFHGYMVESEQLTEPAPTLRYNGLTVIGMEMPEGHKSKAIAAALPYAQANTVALLDADLQYDPELVPIFLKKYDRNTVVSGKRKKRADPFLRKVIPWAGHYLFNALYHTQLQDINSGIKVMPREFFDRINFAEEAQQYHGLHKFLVPIAVWLGMDVREVEVEHHPRTTGSSHITLVKTPYRIWRDFRKLQKKYQNSCAEP